MSEPQSPQLEAGPGGPATTQPRVVYIQSPPTNGLAIAGFVCSFFFSIVGLVLSAVAINQINSSPEPQGGKGLAIAGLVISIVGLAILVVGILFWLAIAGTIFGALAAAAGG